MLRAVREGLPGDEWLRLFELYWPAYERWFLREGVERRPSTTRARARLKRYMPELMPTYKRLLELIAGGQGDRRLAARFLPLYRPPPYLTGCSQLVWLGDEPIMIRNYDYSPHLWEGAVLLTAWSGRRVIAMSDCLWGALDGINEAGLVASLAFGGRRVVGDGFGIPIILRYLLESCRNVSEAAAALRRVPCHMAYNVMVLDRAGEYFTASLAPDRPPIVERVPVATNHQEILDWPEYLAASRSLERRGWLAARLDEPPAAVEELIADFMRPPLYADGFKRGFGKTLYTAVYYPRRGVAEYHWPGHVWRQSFERFDEEELPLPWTAAHHLPALEERPT